MHQCGPKCNLLKTRSCKCNANNGASAWHGQYVCKDHISSLLYIHLLFMLVIISFDSVDHVWFCSDIIITSPAPMRSLRRSISKISYLFVCTWCMRSDLMATRYLMAKTNMDPCVDSWQHDHYAKQCWQTNNGAVSARHTFKLKLCRQQVHTLPALILVVKISSFIWFHSDEQNTVLVWQKGTINN